MNNLKIIYRILDVLGKGMAGGSSVDAEEADTSGTATPYERILTSDALRILTPSAQALFAGSCGTCNLRTQDGEN